MAEKIKVVIPTDMGKTIKFGANDRWDVNIGDTLEMNDQGVINVKSSLFATPPAQEKPCRSVVASPGAIDNAPVEPGFSCMTVSFDLINASTVIQTMLGLPAEMASSLGENTIYVETIATTSGVIQRASRSMQASGKDTVMVFQRSNPVGITEDGFYGDTYNNLRYEPWVKDQTPAAQFISNWQKWVRLDNVATQPSSNSPTYTASGGVTISNGDISAVLGDNVYLNHSGAISTNGHTVRTRVDASVIRPLEGLTEDKIKANGNRYKFYVRLKVSYIDRRPDVSFTGAAPAFSVKDSLPDVKVRLSPLADNELEIVAIEYANGTHHEFKSIVKENNSWVIDVGPVYNFEQRMADLVIFVDGSSFLTERGATVGLSKKINYEPTMEHRAITGAYVASSTSAMLATIEKVS